MRRVAVLLAVLFAAPLPAHAYLHFGVSLRGEPVTLRWGAAPVRWHLKDRGVDGVSTAQLRDAVTRAFATWEAVPTATIAFQFGGLTAAEPFDEDRLSVIGFQSEPDLERVLGATGFVIDTFTGEIVEADIFLNAAFPWSTSAGGDPARFDVESVALHEIGHFIGLAHSGIGETEQVGTGRRVLGSGAVMFPLALGRGSTADRVLQHDDIAGVSDLYPAPGFRDETGAARGRVVRNGTGVSGAHVTAFNVNTGALVGGFSLSRDGEFEIAGLEPGPYVIRIEPLDDADVTSFFDEDDPIDVAFQVTYHDRLFVAPPGGVGERFTVTVRPR